MKKFIAGFLILALIAVMSFGCGEQVEIPDGEPLIREEYSTEAPTLPKFPIKGIALVDRLNVREEPNIRCNVKCQLNTGDEIEVFEIKIIDAIPWGRIKNDMWVNLRYVDLEYYDFTVKYSYG